MMPVKLLNLKKERPIKMPHKTALKLVEPFALYIYCGGGIDTAAAALRINRFGDYQDD